jgi:putative ABC transport system permease protein
VRTLRKKLRRDVRRQRAQFFAIGLTIFLGVAMFGASYDAYRNLNDSYARAFTDYRFANLTITGGESGRIATRAQLTPGVESVASRVEADVPIAVGGTKLLGRVVGMPPDRQPPVDRVEVGEGRYLRGSSPRGVLVEKHMADHFDLRPGDSLRAAGPGGDVSVSVVGIAESPEYFWPARSRQDILPSPDDFGVIFADEALAEKLAGTEGPNQVVVYYDGGEDSSRLTAELTRMAEAHGASSAITRADQPSNSALQEDVKGFQEMAILFPLLFLTAAALATGILMQRLVTSQRPVIGMLRACGYSRGQVTRHYLSFGLAAGIAGSVPGAIAAIALAGAITHSYTDALSIPVTLVRVSPLTVLGGLAFGVLVGALAAALPARAAAKVPPAEAMRSISPPSAGGLSLVERAIPGLRRVPVRWRLVLRSIGRNRRRSLATVAGVVLALTLVLVSWGMVDTAQILIARQFDQVERQDAQLYFRGRASNADFERVRHTAGVARAEPGLETPVFVSANGKSYETALIGLEPDTEMHGFLSADGGSVALGADGVIAGKALAGELGIARGDPVELSIPRPPVRARVPVSAFVDEPLGTYVYASLPAIRERVGDRIGEGNLAFVSYAPGVDREEMRRRLSRLPGVVAFEDSQQLRETVDGYLSLYYAFVGIMLAFGGAMAFALLYNGIQANLAERSIEVATLRAAGIPFRSLARMITAENVLLTLLGIVPGLIVGYLVARGFMASFSSDQFSFDLEVRTSTLVLSSLAIVLVALLSQIPGLRAVRSLDIATVVRERSA